MSNTFTKISLTMDREGLVATQLYTSEEGSMNVACVVLENREDHLSLIEDLHNALEKWDKLKS